MSHISYSEFTTFLSCPYRHKIQYIDRVRPTSIHLIFGSAVHEYCERFLLGNDTLVTLPELFDLYYEEREMEPFQPILKKDIEQILQQGAKFLPEFKQNFSEMFPNYKIIATEKEIYKKLVDKINFKGYIDAIVKVEDIYHIIDFKTCYSGWNQYRKSDIKALLQNAFYKYFSDYNFESTQTHYILLKRVAPAKQRVEKFTVDSSNIIEKGIQQLTKTARMIQKGCTIKKRSSCLRPFRCQFLKTKFCR